MPPTHVPEEVDAGVDVLQRVDGLVQGAHHLLGVLLQLLALLLRLPGLQVLEGVEQVKQLLVLLEQPGIREHECLMTGNTYQFNNLRFNTS